jgi:hypothetical protein
MFRSGAVRAAMPAFERAGDNVKTGLKAAFA